MKVLLLDGFLQDTPSSDAVYRIVHGILGNAGGEIDSFILRETRIAHCMGCFNCWVKTPGQCVINDAGRGIASALVNSDLLLLLTPVTFGGYSSELKKALDRIIPVVSPFFIKVNGEVHHEPRYEKYPRLIGIGVLAHPDEESERIFKTLVSRNAINFHSPGHAAGVLSLNEGSEGMRQKIVSVFAQAGVIA